MIGQRLERALPSPAKIEPTEYQKRGTTKEPEALTPDKITTLQDACDKYAKDAVLQNQENLKIGCGLSSSRWSSDYKAHFNWCMSGNLNNTKGENTARQQALAQCRKDKCDTYAKDAVAAASWGMGDLKEALGGWLIAVVASGTSLYWMDLSNRFTNATTMAILDMSFTGEADFQPNALTTLVFGTAGVVLTMVALPAPTP